MVTPATALKARKSPVQARSTATVDTLHTAAIQVLVHAGLKGCTTTRIAERAGTSVGSLYQYYPNRDALLAAVLEKHLDGIAGAVEVACKAGHGSRVADMASTLVKAYLAAKFRDPDESKSLYAVAQERGGGIVVARMRKRMTTALADMLATASDAHIDDPQTTALFTLGTLVGPIHAVLEGHATPELKARLESDLITLLSAYWSALG